MKSKISFFLFLAFLNLQSHAELKLKSIDEILKTENTPSTFLLALQRCSAVYMTAASHMETREDTKHLSKNMQDLATVFALMAIEYSESESNLANLTIDGNRTAIERMYDAYLEDANNARGLTGNYTDGMMKSDLPLCKTLYEKSNK